jgi:hypothetical protein
MFNRVTKKMEKDGEMVFYTLIESTLQRIKWICEWEKKIELWYFVECLLDLLSLKYYELD